MNNETESSEMRNSKGQFQKGNQFRKGNKGKPKGSVHSKTRLLNLIKDIVKISNSESLTIEERNKIYSLYDIACSDYFQSDLSDFLYFIESDFGIKIGRSANPKARLSQIQKYAPSAKIIKVVNCAGHYEKQLHKLFKKYNIKNNSRIGIEWFTKESSLLDFIKKTDNVSNIETQLNIPECIREMTLKRSKKTVAFEETIVKTYKQTKYEKSKTIFV